MLINYRSKKIDIGDGIDYCYECVKVMQNSIIRSFITAAIGQTQTYFWAKNEGKKIFCVIVVVHLDICSMWCVVAARKSISLINNERNRNMTNGKCRFADLNTNVWRQPLPWHIQYSSTLIGCRGEIEEMYANHLSSSVVTTFQSRISDKESLAVRCERFAKNEMKEPKLQHIIITS